MLENTVHTNAFEQILHAVEHLPTDEQLLLVERIVENIRYKQKMVTSDDIEAACGILQAKHSVSLD